MRRAPYFVKIAKGLRLGYYRGATAGTWIGRRYLGNGSYETDPLGLADDTTEADEVKVLDYWQAQEGRQTLGRAQPTGRCRDDTSWPIQRFRRCARLSRRDHR